MMMFIRLKTTNDINGNPRRVFVVYRDNVVIATHDEGYSGTGELRAIYPKILDGGDFMTTPKEYRKLLAWKAPR